VCPSLIIAPTSSGNSSICCPTKKKVAFTFSFSKTDKIHGVTSGVGPSSKVSQISLSIVSFLQTNEGKSACIILVL